MPIYMNNGATTWPKPERVARAMYDFLAEGGANVARGSASERDLDSVSLVLSCRQKLTDLLGGWGGDPRHTVFTSSVTESLNIVLKGFLRPGMTVLTSAMEHNAVLRPLRRLEESGVKVEIAPCDGEGFLHPEVFAGALERSRPDLVVFSHASNVCGTVQDLPTLAALCREFGTPLVADCAQTAGLVSLDAQGLGLAALCFTGHKGLMGPQGIGGVLFQPSFAERVDWFVEGGTGSFSHLELQPDAMPDKFEAGTPNLPGIAGLLAALEWLKETDLETVCAREEATGAALLEGLLSLPGVVIYGRDRMDGARLPVFAVNFDGQDNGELAGRLFDEFGVETRPGLHCAPLAHRTLGSYPGGSLRISPGYFTTETDVETTLRALRSILG
ncbi:MAG: aminotransferase class V-fold PLP-dependent enzyme [Synergistota bacterium]|nr:aminotransferase class V-fold PLP-dependent enzyme [Synergistota bacterium]